MEANTKYQVLKQSESPNNIQARAEMEHKCYQLHTSQKNTNYHKRVFTFQKSRQCNICTHIKISQDAPQRLTC